MSSVLRIELVMPSKELAKAKFPEAQKKFVGGTAKLAYRAAGISPKIFLEGPVVVVELVFKQSFAAEQLLPAFKQQMETAVAKEQSEKGDCIETRIFIKKEVL